ncbi:MAG: nucleoside 2-deoxyribosyltransferase [Lachnospiraceae bacterium]|nr:nucleoside 2-deoxyribosyltransferase [Lachnospiraceae bacterium]
MKIYLATPVGGPGTNWRLKAVRAMDILVDKGLSVYCPWDMKIPHAWDYPNQEWGLMVFANDIAAINDCDVVVFLSYGRISSAGANWEAGYAFGIGKKVIVVEMSYPAEMSLMVSNGCFARVKGLEGLESYDFSGEFKPTRTDTEQL